MASALELEGQLEALLGDLKRDIDISLHTRVFCNRNLRMEHIEFIGFDMDYTLALYNQEKLEQLSIKLTADKLIANLGYPGDIRTLSYDSRHAIRGVVVDTKLGNVFKMDRLGHVGRVYHGRRLLGREERKAQYQSARINLSQDRYEWIDTLFGLPEAVMYMTLVDYFEERGSGPGYKQLFSDIRASIDEAHRDDTLKSVIKANLSSYIIKDNRLAETLHKLRSSGKKLFVLTNSLYDYTEKVMSFLLDGERAAYPSWRNYFDYVIVGGAKPKFFTESQPFLLVHTDSGEVDSVPAKQLSRDRVYQGGNIIDFETMTGAVGERVLYVGDHIYGDILKLKKSHVWRTAMVVQELDRELITGERMQEQIRDLALLDRRRRNLESEIDYEVAILKRLQKLMNGDSAAMSGKLEEACSRSKETLDSLRDRARLMAEEVHALETAIDRAFNPFWGSIFRERHDNSRFGAQVALYADLYTSRASNFVSYSPMRYFRAPRQQMPHDM